VLVASGVIGALPAATADTPSLVVEVRETVWQVGGGGVTAHGCSCDPPKAVMGQRVLVALGVNLREGPEHTVLADPQCHAGPSPSGVGGRPTSSGVRSA